SQLSLNTEAVLHRIGVLDVRIEYGEYVDDTALDVVVCHDLAKIIVEQRPLQIGSDDVLLRERGAERHVGRALRRLPHGAGLLGAEDHAESTANHRLAAGGGIVAEPEARPQIHAGIGEIGLTGIANRTDVKVVVEKSVGIVEAAAFAAVLLRLRRLIGIIIV